MLYEAKDIYLSYQDQKVLKGCCFAIDSGQMVAVTGKSGVGKSTLLSVLGLLLSPDSGALVFKGEHIEQLSSKEKAGMRSSAFGFVFQRPQLIGSLTLRENVLVPASISGKKELGARADELIELLGLSDRAHHFPFQLSVGQQRRLSLARALLNDPELVFLDEPTNDLDEENARIVTDVLKGVVKEGRAVALVTHDKGLALGCDVAYELCDGALLEEPATGSDTNKEC